MPRNQANLRSVCHQDAHAKYTSRHQAPGGVNVDDEATRVYTDGASFRAYAEALALRVDRGEIRMDRAVALMSAVCR